MSPLAFSAAIGGFVIILLKSLKYTLFEPTREMAYIPLDEELRTKGKAAVDVLGSNIGEASSGYIQIILFKIIATKDAVILAPYACVVFVVFCFTWLCAVKIMARKVL